MTYEVDELLIDEEGEDREVTIDFSVIGKYRHATYWHPAEDPDIEVTTVTEGGTDVTEVLYDRAMDVVEQLVADGFCNG